MAIKSVTLNYNGHYGALDYNEETKELTVTIKGETPDRAESHGLSCGTA